MSHKRVGTSTGNPDADLNAVRREALAFQLRAQGYDFPAIADQLGYANPSGAYKAYRRALARIPRQAVDEMRATILAAQDLALKAMRARIEKGDTFAVREMTMIHDRRAKLFGLDVSATDPANAGTPQVKLIRQGGAGDADYAAAG